MEVVEKIKKLLTLSKDKAATESEAQAAALVAQKLLAKYNIDIDVVNVSNEEAVVKGTIDSSEYKGYIWARHMAAIIAKNYCCKVFLTEEIKGKNIVFYGFKEHTEVAKSVFKFLFEIGNNLALTTCREYTKKYGHSRGVYNSFVLGFVSGVESKLNEQCVALSIVVPTKVEEEYKKLGLVSNRENKVTISRRDAEIREKGYNAGRETFNRRSLNEAV